MTFKMVSGNEAVAYAALASGVKVIAGYPGTPSSEVIASLLKQGEFSGTKIEWSTSEKVATEVAGAAAWAGKRAMCTMKMSGLNVAYDSLCGIAYSGCNGGMVVYVCDDPGVTTGMVEQDIRGFAAMTDMVVLEPANVKESYEMIKYAFELSEFIGYPVFVRSVTNVAQSHSAIEIEDRVLPSDEPATFTKDITKYTKAGAKICMDQHRGIIEGLEKSYGHIYENKINKLNINENAKIGVVSVGVANTYINEAISLINRYCDTTVEISTLRVGATIPYPVNELNAMLEACDKLVIIEENATYLERQAMVQAYKLGKQVEIIGKEDKTLSPIGAFDALIVAGAIASAFDITLPQTLLAKGEASKAMAAPRPIGVCAGCPHRGTYLGINKAIRNLGYKKDEVIVTGDIGCTILGMNPPFDTLWTEVSMGASIPLAQGFKYAGIEKPVIATIGDSTFFLGGFPGLVNAIQHNINMTVVILDNSWTAMTGMQVNPNTPQEYQYEGCKEVSIVNTIAGLGVFPVVVDPFNQTETIAAIEGAIKHEGMSIVIAKRECTIQSNRRGVKYNTITLDTDKCNSCKACVRMTGCPAISFNADGIVIDEKTCNGCGLCAGFCAKDAIILS